MVYDVDHRRPSFEHFKRWLCSVRCLSEVMAAYVKSRYLVWWSYDGLRWSTMIPDGTIVYHRRASCALWDRGITRNLVCGLEFSLLISLYHWLPLTLLSDGPPSHYVPTRSRFNTKQYGWLSQLSNHWHPIAPIPTTTHRNTGLHSKLSVRTVRRPELDWYQSKIRGDLYRHLGVAFTTLETVPGFPKRDSSPRNNPQQSNTWQLHVDHHKSHNYTKTIT